MLRAGLVLTAVFASCGAALANQCLQKHATYTDEDGQLELQFLDLGIQQGLSTNAFDLKVSKSGEVFKGWVLWNGEAASRPDAVITHQCPGGDITGTELDACKVWQGIVYSLWPDGDVDLLPPGEDPATQRLILSDFGRTLRQSKSWAAAKLDKVPWDVFTFSGCKAPS